MKKYLFCLILLLIPFNIHAIELNTYSNNVILYKLDDNSVLYEKNSDEVVSIASLTKIMTGVVALENIKDMNEKVVLVSDDFSGLREANASQAGFYIGEEVTYSDLLNGLLLPSGADAARALSRLIAGGEKEFVNLMNDKAKELNLSNTHFMNITGLDEEGHYSTVKDVSKLLKYALENNDFIDIISKDYYQTSNGEHTFKSTILKLKELSGLEFKIDGINYFRGGKTGTTGDAGLCLASRASYNGVDYLLVTAKAPLSRENPYNLLDAKTIYEYFMTNYSYKNVVNKNDKLVSINTKYIKEDSISFKSSKNVKVYLDNSFDKSKIEYKYDGKTLITHKMKKGEKLGSVKIIYNGEILDEEVITLDRDVKFDLEKYIKENKYISYIFYTLLFIIISFFIILLKKKKRV